MGRADRSGEAFLSDSDGAPARKRRRLTTARQREDGARFAEGSRRRQSPFPRRRRGEPSVRDSEAESKGERPRRKRPHKQRTAREEESDDGDDDDGVVVVVEAAEAWSCIGCTLDNRARAQQCTVCGMARPRTASALSSPASPRAPAWPPPPPPARSSTPVDLTLTRAAVTAGLDSVAPRVDLRLGGGMRPTRRTAAQTAEEQSASSAHAPASSSALAVNARKVAEVRRWLSSHACGEGPAAHAQSMLILSGPPGSGKRTLVLPSPRRLRARSAPRRRRLTLSACALCAALRCAGARAGGRAGAGTVQLGRWWRDGLQQAARRRARDRARCRLGLGLCRVCAAVLPAARAALRPRGGDGTAQAGGATQSAKRAAEDDGGTAPERRRSLSAVWTSLCALCGRSQPPTSPGTARTPVLSARSVRRSSPQWSRAGQLPVPHR